MWLGWAPDWEPWFSSKATHKPYPVQGRGGREQKAAAPWGLERETESWQWGQPGRS